MEDNKKAPCCEGGQGKREVSYMLMSKRMCISVTPELEQKIVDLRKKPEYERKSISEVARILIEKGLEQEK